METAAQSDEPARDRLYHLSRVLLATTSVDEVITRAPEAIAGVLGWEWTYRIILLDLPLTKPGTGPGHLCIPLRHDGELLGTLLVGDRLESTLTTPELDDNTMGVVADLVATALAARIRLTRQHAALLTEAAKLRLDAVSMLSHEMRTPLAAIKGYATALLMEEAGWDDATRHEFLQTIDEESDRLTRLIEDILESTAIEADALRMDLEPVLLPRISRRVVERMAIQSDIHRFVVMFPPTFPIVEADAGRIEQVLVNLLDNAVKYSPEGGLTVVRGDILPDEVVVSVVDQGIGIAPEDLNKLFERFFRAPAGRRSVAGTGLGLPISSAIVRAHGGRIWAESTLGRGTTLSFTIPYTALEQ